MLMVRVCHLEINVMSLKSDGNPFVCVFLCICVYVCLVFRCVFVSMSTQTGVKWLSVCTVRTWACVFMDVCVCVTLAPPPAITSL